ncbi:uncharacterized protein V1477_014907 [Vespula maculifrons]|uniref:Uncharacterized protein n=1 Tax=Vespula maculifrons TaxID=7453 RepID=A0ABD2BIS2_VESMC
MKWCELNGEVGIISHPQRQYNRTGSQVTVQSCFEFRRVHIGVLVVRVLCKMKWCGGDTFPPVTTTNSDLQSTLPVTSSVSLCLPTKPRCADVIEC